MKIHCILFSSDVFSTKCLKHCPIRRNCETTTFEIHLNSPQGVKTHMCPHYRQNIHLMTMESMKCRPSLRNKTQSRRGLELGETLVRHRRKRQMTFPRSLVPGPQAQGSWHPAPVHSTIPHRLPQTQPQDTWWRLQPLNGQIVEGRGPR